MRVSERKGIPFSKIIKIIIEWLMIKQDLEVLPVRSHEIFFFCCCFGNREETYPSHRISYSRGGVSAPSLLSGEQVQLGHSSLLLHVLQNPRTGLVFYFYFLDLLIFPF